MLAIIAGIITLLIWLWLLLAHGGFWRVRRFMALPRNSDLAAKIAVIIPARDEAEVVGRCISSLLRQTYRGPVHIFLVDDGSKDGTAQAARQAAEQSGKTSALTIIQGAPPPAGWSGKLWAVQQGIQRARELGAQFFLLTDADIEHAPESISTLAAIAESGQMISRSAFSQLHHSAFMLLLAMAGLIATYLLPPVLLFAGHSLPALLGATAWLLMIVAYMPMIRFYRLTPLWTLFLPVVAIFYMGATLHSAIKYWR